jgi:hypothetical protein
LEFAVSETSEYKGLILKNISDLMNENTFNGSDEDITKILIAICTDKRLLGRMFSGLMTHI